MKSKNDLTIIFLTANRVPKSWAKYQKAVLLKAAKDLPIITISKKPLDWGMNLLQTEAYGVSNVYFQLLKGAKIATTPYIAVAEDDALYPMKHFHTFRPPLDTFAYNHNRMALFTWGRPVYGWKYHPGNSVLIAPRELLIEALEERFQKYPNGTPDELTGEVGRQGIEDRLGLTRRKSTSFDTTISVLRIDHDFGLDILAKKHNKHVGAVRATSIPHWGRAKDVIKRFK